MNKTQFDIHMAAHSRDAHEVLLTDKYHKKALRKLYMERYSLQWD